MELMPLYTPTLVSYWLQCTGFKLSMNSDCVLIFVDELLAKDLFGSHASMRVQEESAFETDIHLSWIKYVYTPKGLYHTRVHSGNNYVPFHYLPFTIHIVLLAPIQDCKPRAVRIVLCFFILVVDVCVLCDLHRSFLPCVTAIMTLPKMIMISASLHETLNRGIREM